MVPQHVLLDKLLVEYLYLYCWMFNILYSFSSVFITDSIHLYYDYHYEDIFRIVAACLKTESTHSLRLAYFQITGEVGGVFKIRLDFS